jgi:4-hydroxy-4-methyl-2-oxoglutarate aldolase
MTQIGDRDGDDGVPCDELGDAARPRSADERRVALPDAPDDASDSLPDDVPEDLRAELLDLGSATVFEASGLDCALDPSFRPAWAGARVVGTALPVLAAAADNLPLHWALESARRGDVLVVDAGGSPYGFWGEVLAVAAQARGVRGIVIDGGVRDTDRLRELAFAAFSTSISIRGTGKGWRGRIGEPVTLRGRPVHRGDLVVADSDGVAVVPVSAVAATVTAARLRAAKEQEYLRRLRGGERTVDLYGFRSVP